MERESIILDTSMINTVESMSFEQQMELIINNFKKIIKVGEKK